MKACMVVHCGDFSPVYVFDTLNDAIESFLFDRNAHIIQQPGESSECFYKRLKKNGDNYLHSYNNKLYYSYVTNSIVKHDKYDQLFESDDSNLPKTIDELRKYIYNNKEIYLNWADRAPATFKFMEVKDEFVNFLSEIPETIRDEYIGLFLISHFNKPNNFFWLLSDKYIKYSKLLCEILNIEVGDIKEIIDNIDEYGYSKYKPQSKLYFYKDKFSFELFDGELDQNSQLLHIGRDD